MMNPKDAFEFMNIMQILANPSNTFSCIIAVKVIL